MVKYEHLYLNPLKYHQVAAGVEVAPNKPIAAICWEGFKITDADEL
jgi:hypothetical protein